jgi:hypothetical protein
MHLLTGPNWIHGTNGNPMMRLASKTGTVVLSPDEEYQALIDTKGVRRPDAEGTELAGKIWELVVDAFRYSDEHSSEIDPRTSLYEYFKSKLEADKSLDRQKRDDLLQEAQMWGPFVGDSVEKQSLKFFFLEECIDGENVFVASTYRNILAEIERTVIQRERVDLRLKTEIVHFETTSANNGNTDEHGVTITASTGEKNTFDEVVLTCPLGWLKQNHVQAFTPSLPPRLCSALSNVNYGRLEKLYVTFPSAFWLASTGHPQQDLDSYPIFTHYHDPTYIPHPAAEAWNQSVVSLAHLPSPHAHPTLLFYMYGDCATHVVNQIKSLEQGSHEYNSALKMFAQPFYSRLPNYDSDDSRCEPTAFLMTKWQDDALAGNGSYSNFQIGLDNADQDIECMRNAGGLTEKGLWMAGEHTAPWIALGTTTGAWWSGEAVAKRICQQYGIEIPKDLDVEIGSVEVMGDHSGAGKKELDKTKPDGANLTGLAI